MGRNKFQNHWKIPKKQKKRAVTKKKKKKPEWHWTRTTQAPNWPENIREIAESRSVGFQRLPARDILNYCPLRIRDLLQKNWCSVIINPKSIKTKTTLQPALDCHTRSNQPLIVTLAPTSLWLSLSWRPFHDCSSLVISFTQFIHKLWRFKKDHIFLLMRHFVRKSWMRIFIWHMPATFNNVPRLRDNTSIDLSISHDIASHKNAKTRTNTHKKMESVESTRC